MLLAIRSVSRLFMSSVETETQKAISSAFRPVSASLSSVRAVRPSTIVASQSVSTVVKRSYCSKLVEEAKSSSLFGRFYREFKQDTFASVRKIFPPIRSSTSYRVIAGLNRFGPLQTINPMFIWNLQTTFRPYLTMTVSLVSAILFATSAVGTPDSIMRLAAVPMRFWSGDYERALTSPLITLNPTQFLACSGFFLALSTAIEVAAGPLVLLSVLLATSLVGVGAAICAPERTSNLYVEKVQMGLLPTVLGMSAFGYFGFRTTPHTYIMRNPNLSRENKVNARQLIHTLGQRRLPIVFAAVLALLPVYNFDTTVMGGLAAGAVGALLGKMWTRSPHLVLVNAVAATAATLYLAKRPAWTVKYRAYEFAQAWEAGEFIRAREWWTLFSTQARGLTPQQTDWHNVLNALTEMSCGRTASALQFASQVNIDTIVLKDDIEHLKGEITQEWVAANQQEGHRRGETNITIGRTPTTNPNNLPSAKRYQEALLGAPWRIMNDDKLLALFYATFVENPQITPLEQQELILNNYKGLFNFDPTYQRGLLLRNSFRLQLPKRLADNPLQ